MKMKLKQIKDYHIWKALGVPAVVFLFIVLCLSIYLFCAFLPDANKKVDNRAEPPASSAHMEKTADGSPEQEASVTAAPREQEASDSVKIVDLSEEALTLLACTKEQLAEEIKEFLNANGFADIREVVYEKEIVISHGDDTVSAGFYLQRNGETYEICCIYDRKNFSRSMMVWE